MDNIRDSLAHRLLDGDRTAAQQFVDMFYQPIFLYMRRLGHSRQTSEELTQDCFLQAWKHIGQLRNVRALGAWLYRIASNVSNQYWRRHRSGDNVSLDDIAPPDDIGTVDSAKASEELEQINRLKIAIGRLPAKLKQAIVLHYLQQLTIADAAEAIHVREGTLKSRLNRALKILKRELG